jgi:hypothetical protein
MTYYYIVGYNTDDERDHIIQACREHNHIIITRRRDDICEDVGHKIIDFQESTFSSIYKTTLLKDKLRAIIIENQGDEDVIRAFLARRQVYVLDFTKAMDKRLNDYRVLYRIHQDDEDENENVMAGGAMPWINLIQAMLNVRSDMYKLENGMYDLEDD